MQGPFFPRARSWWPAILVLALLGVAVYCAYPFFVHCREFRHTDILPVYAPFREWFHERLRAGHWPLWDPYTGVGKFAEVWTLVPVDLFTPLELLWPALDFSRLFALQIAFLFLWSYFSLRRLPLAPPFAAWAALFFFFAPVTTYFLFFFFPGWSYAFLLGAFAAGFRFLETGQRAALVWGMASALCFSIGGKTEALALNLVALAGATLLYATLRGGRTWARAALFLAALVVPPFVHAWAFEVIRLSALASARLEHLPFSWGALGASFREAFRDSFLMLALASLALFVPVRAPGARTRVAGAMAALALAFFWAATSGTSHAGGYLLGAAFSLAACARRRRFLRILPRLAPGFVVALYYVGRPAPGDLEEGAILQTASYAFQFLLAFFATQALGGAGARRITRWCWCFLATLLFMRGFGTVLLSHFVGLLWLPARDNYIFDLTFAVLSALGAAAWARRARVFGRRPVRDHALALAAIALITITHPRFFSTPLSCGPLDSFRLRRQVAELAAVVPTGRAYPPRVFQLTQGMARLFGLADVRLWDSFVPARYARVSIAQRLGIPPASAYGLTGFTNDMSDHLRRLARPVPDWRAVAPPDRRGISFYPFYVLAVVPPWSCDALRLFGVEFVERTTGYTSVPAILNGLYAREPFGSAVPNAEVRAAIAACHFAEVSSPEGFSYWRVDHPLPRAIFLPGVGAEQLAGDFPERVAVTENKINLGKGPWRWEEAEVESYEPERVRVRVRAREPGTLLLTDEFQDLWHAEVNGRAAEITPALSLFRAVAVPAGESETEFRLEDPHRFAVWVVSALAVLGMLLLWWGSARLPRPADS